MSTNRHRAVAARLILGATASFLLDTVSAVAQEERRNVLWKDPGDVAALDLFWANGSAERAPAGPFTFIDEDTNGTQPKVRVRDSAGRQWSVKFGDEVHSELAANRLVWALGYWAEELYFVPSGTVAGVGRSGRAKDHIAPDGTFHNARFGLLDEGSVRAGERWTFDKNPFVGTQELSGLKVLMTLVNNWDIQGGRNNRVLRVEREERYIVSDLGASFGKMGALPPLRNKWNLEDFKKEEFITRVHDGMVDLDYEGFDDAINKVPLEHARWFVRMVGQLTDVQLQDALRASGANDTEVAGFAARLREKITELHDAVGASNVIP